MRIFFSLIFLVLSLLSAATTYYIDPAGNDTNNGTVEFPWRTLSHACSQVKKSGDIIHVNAGTYLETDRCDLAIGVSIEGVGDASHIISHYVTSGNTNGFISLETLVEGTNGNQSISFIKLDGDLTGTIAMYVLGRSNVKIHHCTVIDFTDSGIGFRGGYPVYIPKTYATGNEIYNCTIENSSSRIGVASHGLIRLSGQSGMHIHDNILIQTGRPAGQNGNIVDAVEGHNKGLKYYNNKSYKPVSEGSAYNFHIESWNTDGGMEIFSNEFHGGGCHVDVAGQSNIKGTYDYSWWIHDNLFMMDSQMPRNQGEPYVVAISFEATIQDAIISSNHFKNLPYGIYHTINQSDRFQRNISIYSNLFENMGYSNNDWAFAIILCTYEDLAIPSLFDNFHIYNNTITSGNPGRLTGGVHIQKAGSVSNIYIRNNIITNCSYPYYIYKGTGTLSNIYIQNNVLFGNGNDNKIYNPGSISNYVNEGSIIADPLFVSTFDFRLSSGSPAIDAGINVGLPYSGLSPDIGAFEMSNGDLHLNQLPVVTISSPTKGESFTSPATVNIDAEAYDPDGTIAKVEFFNGSTKLGEKTAAPFSFTWKDVTEGSYSLTAVATDNLSSVTVSATVPVSVLKAASVANQLPVISISSPSKGSSYPAPATISIDVEATDPDGTISKVELFSGTIKLDEMTAAPYSFTLKDLAEGSYSLMAVATDNMSATTTSAPTIVECYLINVEQGIL